MSPEIKEKYGIVKRKCFGVPYWLVTKVTGNVDKQIRLDASQEWHDWMVIAMISDNPLQK